MTKMPAGKATATATATAMKETSSKAVEAALPEDRAALLKLHRELRHRRDALPLLSEERADTVIELARVEVQVARIERAMDPPLG
ncbi:MAG TPA: hypothetical protein VEX41_05065 [Candidatus Eisenbacteria bacterium]|nr:hypothetical protein [Candidatus Eisenbacteria bacterium]